MQKIKVLLLISILLAVLVGCSQTPQTLKLNDEQQVLADTFFNNRELWEYYDDLYCTGLSMYNSQDAVIFYCEYGSRASERTNEAVSSYVILKTYSFKVTEEKVEFIRKVDTSVLAAGVILNSKTNVSPDGRSSYYYGDDETSKKELINKLLSKYKSKE